MFTEALQQNAGKDSRQDAWYSGYICAVKDLLNIQLEEFKEIE